MTRYELSIASKMVAHIFALLFFLKKQNNSMRIKIEIMKDTFLANNHRSNGNK